ncbi:MAG: hypothetical protein C0399_03735 [Syntrophus sp. (in: bacteria)]|nr:hypothetical protein [Syntrophus sp. (in: bacteria)]
MNSKVNPPDMNRKIMESDSFRYDEKNDLYFHGNSEEINYADGSEAYLIDVFQQVDGTDIYSEELQKKIHDWPSRYRLSYLRANLFEAVKSIFKKTWTVLELGAGTGAITAWLASNCTHVDAVEGSVNRAKALRLRTKGMKNVRVIVGDITNMVFPRKYDLITLVGVLEYIPYYCSDRNSQDTCVNFIAKLRAYLNDDGVLLIATENKLGAKYLSGCAEDHNNKLFSGIMDYPEKSPVTFSRNELGDILQRACFPHHIFYHLFPDYKLTKVLYKEETDRSNTMMSGWIRGIFEDYSGQREYLFCDSLFIETIVKARLLHHFSNSFMILCSPSEKVDLKTDWLIQKFSNHEHINPVFHHTSSLEMREGRINIVRKPFGRGRHSVDYENVRYTLTPYETFVEGQILITEAYKKVFIADGYLSLARLLTQVLKGLIENYSDGTFDQDGYHIIDGHAIDYCFWNLIQSDDQKFHFIDKKWQYKKQLTSDYIAFRNLYYLYYDLAPFITEENSQVFVMNVMNRIYPHYSIERYFQNLALESAFQSDIASTEARSINNVTGISKKAYRTYMDTLEGKYEQNEAVLRSIYASYGWKLLQKYYRMRDRYFPLVHRWRSTFELIGKAHVVVNKMNIRKSLSYIAKYGLRNFMHRAKENIVLDSLYQEWLQKMILKQEEIQAQRDTKFLLEPEVSIVVPVYNTRKEFLEGMIESVIAQTYPKWELCIADGCSEEAYIKEILTKYSLNDKRIKVRFLNQNKGIAGNSNEAIALSSGSYITFLDHDDLLPQHALFEAVRTINENPGADFIYSDEDKITEDGSIRVDPHFKPDWSPDTLKSYNYIAHLTVIKKDLIDEIGWFQTGYDGSQDYDLFLRATEHARRIVHISKILYHWRIIEGSTAFNPVEKPYTQVAGKRALEDHMNRLGIEGKVEDGLFANSYRIKYKLNRLPLISVIIPNRDNAQELAKCIESITVRSTYRNIEIIIMENGSKDDRTFDLYRRLENINNVKIFTWNKPFNYSQINNDGVRHAKGEMLLFLNNDVEAINPDWIDNMVQHAVCEKVGCVGAKLYYKNNTVQHAGIVVGLCGIAGHPFKGFPRGSHGHKGRLNVIQNISAVTGACLMMRKNVFDEVGGFDEGYPLAFNDVDLCMKVRQHEYLIIYTPYAELYHYESKTRGLEDTTEKIRRFTMEMELFRAKWSSELKKGDPYYNSNLSLSREDFAPDV